MTRGIHTVTKQKSVGASAVTLGADFSFLKSNTKMLIVIFEALSNGGSQTLANVLTQMGTIWKLDSDKFGTIVNYQTFADLYYHIWSKTGKPPKVKMHTTDNDVIKIIFAIKFGRDGHSEEGLPASQLTMNITFPADGNSIDTRKITIYQITEDSSYSKLLKLEYNAHTPSTTGKKLPLPIEPRSKEILSSFFYQTTAGDDTTTDTTTIEAMVLYKDSLETVFEVGASDLLMELWHALHGNGDGQTIYDVTETLLGNYIFIDFIDWFGKPIVPSQLGVVTEFGWNIVGGDTNAVRHYLESLIPC
jgi:hypothetical protein